MGNTLSDGAGLGELLYEAAKHAARKSREHRYLGDILRARFVHCFPLLSRTSTMAPCCISPPRCLLQWIDEYDELPASGSSTSRSRRRR